MILKIDGVKLEINEKGIISKDKLLKKEIEILTTIADTNPNNGNGYLNIINEFYKNVEVIKEDEDEIY